MSLSLMGFTQFLLVAVLLYMILNSYFCALFIGPGFVPLGWRPVSEDSWTFASAHPYVRIC